MADQATIDDTDYSLEGITKRLEFWTKGIELFEEREECDEDGTTCPTGRVIGVEKDWTPDEYNDDSTFEFCSFDESSDAALFIQLIKDQQVLLKRLTN